MEEQLLELRNVCFDVVDQNGDKKQILKNINLRLDKNKIVVITGHNGSGKTTLVKIIMGILSPTSGQIFLDGENITKLSIDERARKGIAFAFQAPVRFKGMTVEKLLHTAFGKPASLGEVCAVLSKVGLCARNYLKRELSANLSGGELKRIEIASVLARDARLNIFDEPEAGIDLWSYDSLINVFKDLKRKSDSLNIIVSHQEKIMEIADEILILNSAEVQSFGKSDVILKNIKKPICKKLKGGK